MLCLLQLYSCIILAIPLQFLVLKNMSLTQRSTQRHTQEHSKRRSLMYELHVSQSMLWLVSINHIFIPCIIIFLLLSISRLSYHLDDCLSSELVYFFKKLNNWYNPLGQYLPHSKSLINLLLLLLLLLLLATWHAGS